MNFADYKGNILSYLRKTEEYERQDIEDHKNLSDEEKEELGYMIREAVVIEDDGNGNVELQPNINNTKWRIGDSVRYASLSTPSIYGTATITDNFENCLCLTGMPKNSRNLDKFSFHYFLGSTTRLSG